jgi:repressor LexA
MDPSRQAPSAAARLTPAQGAVLKRLEAEWAAGRRVESLEHLCRLLGRSSRGALHRHVEALVRAGCVAPLDRHRLGLHPPLALDTPVWPTGLALRALPRLGRIAAGAPLDAVFDEERVLVPERLAPRGEAYVLEVRGDSMSGDGILDGDLVVVEVDAHVRPGEVAVVLVVGEGATLKRFRQEGDQIRLIASNPEVPDRLVMADQVAIQGRISGLMRHFRQ